MNFDRETRRDVGIYQAMLLRVLPAANAPVSLWRFSIQFVADGRLLVTLGCLVSLLFCGFWPSKTVAQADVTGEKILVLFYNNSFSEFKQEFGAGVQDYLQNNRNDLPNIRLSYEYLGLGGVPQNIRPDVIIDMLKFKQQFDPASLVISVLYPTANFLNSFGEEIYEDIPIIYTFPSAEMADLLAAENRRDITIIRSIQNLRIRNSLALIPKLIPETAHLYVISGSSDIDLILKTSTAASLSSLMPEMQVTYLTGLPIEELSSRVSNLAENSAIFMLSYGEDRNHSALRAIDILPLIIDRADLPIFTPISSLFPQGVVGGSFSSAALAGRNSAESAIAMLRGGDSAAAGIDGPAYYQFDQRQLRRWGIDEELLPPNSTIVNQTSTFLELYAQQLLILLSVVAVLLTVVAFFKRQANNLGTQKTLFESVINSIPDAIFITNADAQIFATNKGAEQLFAFSKGELLGRYVRSLMDYSVVRADEIPSGLNVLQRSIEPQVLKYKKKNGEVFPGETIATQITSSSGEMLGHFALIRDISKRLSLEEEQRQGQKMEALGNLVGGISHDFNNILGVISGYAELSKMTKESESIDANQNQILKATDRAKSLVSQIMAFSRDSDIE